MFGEQYMTSRERFQEQDERSYESRKRRENEERFEVPSDEEVKETLELRALDILAKIETELRSRDILTQIGWHRKDRCFLALNLTDEQMATISVAYAESGMASIEEFLTGAAGRWK